MKLFIEIEKSDKGFAVVFYNDCNKMLGLVDNFQSWHEAWDYAVGFNYPNSVAGYNDIKITDRRNMCVIRNLDHIDPIWRGMLGEVLGEIPNWPGYFNVLINRNGKDTILVLQTHEIERLQDA